MLKMYIATYAIDFVALIYLLGLLCNTNMLDNSRKKSFLYGIVLTLIIILSEAVTVLYSYGKLNSHILNISCNIIGFAFAPMVPVILTSIFDTNILRKHKLLFIPTLLNIIAAVLSPSLRIIFYFDEFNQYNRGDYFFVFVAVYIINLLILVVNTIYTSKKYHYFITQKIICLSFFTVVGTCVQLMYPSVYSSWHCITLSLFLYFIYISEFDISFDALTGLYSRATYEKIVTQMSISKAFSVIILDIDSFKNINDTYGHDYGDTVIKLIASIIRESLDRNCTCFRTGGDEFLIICNDTNEQKIECQLKSMIIALNEKRRIDDRLPSISYGYSIFRGGKKPDFQEILKEADDQMYYFKKLNKVKDK
ncbi:MAG: GGDEF domain-containing protein [Tissierellia bacterium]|nr:GGDEF domain-containing protein [Tissierellia bacterium]